MIRIALALLALFACLLPSFIAVYRDKRHKNAILVANVLAAAVLGGGWLGFRGWGMFGVALAAVGLAGWVAVMVWSLQRESPKQEGS